jgi:hypothetical protein
MVRFVLRIISVAAISSCPCLRTPVAFEVLYKTFHFSEFLYNSKVFLLSPLYKQNPLDGSEVTNS